MSLVGLGAAQTIGGLKNEDRFGVRSQQWLHELMYNCSFEEWKKKKKKIKLNYWIYYSVSVIGRTT